MQLVEFLQIPVASVALCKTPMPLDVFSVPGAGIGKEDAQWRCEERDT